MKHLKLPIFLLIFCVSAFSQKYSIEQYLQIRSAYSPSFSRDGKKIAYLTNTTGTSQVWIVDAKGGAPKQLTNYDDNVSFARFSPKTDTIIFGKAIGGNENTQFYLMSADGSNVRALTSDGKIRHNFGDWSEDGTKIYYASNKRNRNFFDVYSMEVENGNEELIYQQDGSNSFVTANPSGSKIIVSRSSERFSLDNDLYLIDVRTKSIEHLTPHEDASQFGNAHFVADGLIFGTDNRRENYNLAKLRKKNAARDDWSAANREVRFLENENWDLDDIEMLPFGNAIAYTINREGFSELYIRKLETGGKPIITNISATAEKIELPAEGILGGLTFSEDGKKLAFSFSSPTHNSDIWSYDLNSKKFTQVTESDKAGIPQTSFLKPALIKYKTFDGRAISAWFYSSAYLQGFVLPSEGESVRRRPNKIAKIPVIVSVHGGPEGQERPSFNALYQFYLSRGYAILAPNVRGSTGYGKTFSHLDDVRLRENSVKDLTYAVDWLKWDGGADPKRIAVMGGSYGGYMTMAAITLYPDLWAAAVNTVGIVNWETFLKNTSGYRRISREVEYGSLEKDVEFLRSISPIAYVNRIKCPLFVIHGKNDPRVPYTEAEQIVSALKKRGAVVQYKLYDDEGHGISKLKNRLDLHPQVADFLDKYLINSAK